MSPALAHGCPPAEHCGPRALQPRPRLLPLGGERLPSDKPANPEGLSQRLHFFTLSPQPSPGDAATPPPALPPSLGAPPPCRLRSFAADTRGAAGRVQPCLLPLSPAEKPAAGGIERPRQQHTALTHSPPLPELFTQPGATAAACAASPSTSGPGRLLPLEILLQPREDEDLLEDLSTLYIPRVKKISLYDDDRFYRRPYAQLKVEHGEYAGTQATGRLEPLWLQIQRELSLRKLTEGSQYQEELKYDFNIKGELRHLDTNESFVFNYYKNGHEQNHKRYEVLGHFITQYVYELLERVCMLQKVYIPTDATQDEPRSFFFMSKNALTSSSSLIILLQDRGVFCAGQWGRRAIVSEGLRHGTQIPFIKMALQSQWEVIVLNPNDNFTDLNTENERFSAREEALTFTQSVWWIPKRGSSSPDEHTMYVWDHFIAKSAARNVAFIAHGYGGLVFVDLLVQRKHEVINKVYSVAFIDSTHNMQHQSRHDPEIQEWIRRNCREWVSNSKPLNKTVGFLMRVNCPTLSAGTEKYGLAPSCCLQPIFKYLKNKLKAKITTALRNSPVATRSSTCKKRDNK
ncbi:putative protein FAM172B [Poecile atricapillus]|uniref:putative protein FAM172B n=1 Tax=Poecile atricapillus TaxID=48891 RepID=UPI00273936E4|nr:putative protein FAM172B [Poecile atricapillus]